MRKFKFFLKFTFSSFLLMATCVYGAGRMPFHQEYSFIQQTKGGILQYDAEHKFYRLTLEEVSPWVFYMSNNSDHETGLIFIDKFIQAINSPSKFHSKSIYGEMTGVVIKNNEIKQYTLNMRHPAYNSKLRTLTFDVNVLLTQRESAVSALSEYIKLEPVVLVTSRKISVLDMRNGS